MKKKIAIIGAGPVGCFLARLLKKEGFDLLLMEEHSEIGQPVHCTGLVGKSLFTDKELSSIPKKAVINTINGATIHYDSQSFDLVRENVAYVVDRERFDKELGKGLNVAYGNKFIGLERDGEGYTVITDKEEFNADIVIGADGANSSVRRIIEEENKVTYHKGLQLRIEYRAHRHDFVDVYLGKSHFFWVVPEGKNIARVGVISENPHKDLHDFMSYYKIKGRVVERFGGLVALGSGINTYKDNIALVGGAACQVKPLSYGGVYFGMKAAVILSSCISQGRLDRYDFLWKEKLYPEIRIGLKLKNIYGNLSQDDLKKVFDILKSNKSFIEKIGDFEGHSQLFLQLLSKPGFYSQAGDLLRILVKSVFY